MIRFENVFHHYGSSPILSDLSLHVAPGELAVVMGPNGMGKSTLLALAGGILSPLSGQVVIDGKVRRSTVENEVAIRKMVAYLPADPFLPQKCTGREFLLAVGRIYKISEMRLMEHTDQLLKIFELAKHADQPISSYSTGQQKKIGICSALITEAPVLILDEPFSGGLDSSALYALGKILKNLADRKDVTVLMAVPVPELVEPIAHKIAILSEGTIIEYDSPKALREKAQATGPFHEVLEHYLHPDVLENVDAYLKE